MRSAMIAAVSLAIAVGVQAQSTETTLTGYVTDTYCGRRGANDKHAEHARRSVASGVAQYALYDEASKKLYILSLQSTAAQYVGQRVQITGTLSTTPIKSAGQSLAPDAVAAYKDPSASDGLRAILRLRILTLAA